jgi:Holliday junction resolvasome RuvABC ATP-dependent DNA helicase subunit
VGWVLIHKLLDQIEVAEESIPDLAAIFRRQRSEPFGIEKFTGKYLETLVHKAHQRPVELAEQFDILGFEQHGVHQSRIEPYQYYSVAEATSM